MQSFDFSGTPAGQEIARRNFAIGFVDAYNELTGTDPCRDALREILLTQFRDHADFDGLDALIASILDHRHDR